MNERSPSILYASNMLSFHPENFVKEYMVKVVVRKDQNKENILLYRVRTTWNKSINQGFFVKVETRDFLINYNEPSLLIELLAEECRQPLQKIDFELNEFGQIEAIKNYDEIVEKWKETKKEIALKYSGEVVEKYIKLQDAVMYEYDVLVTKLKKDLFLNQFFYPIYNNVFREFKLDVIEKSNLLGINYLFPMQFISNDGGKYDENQHLHFEKRINEKEYDFDKMPVSIYEAKYGVSKDHSIEFIKGNFETFGQKLDFYINAVPDTKAFDI